LFDKLDSFYKAFVAPKHNEVQDVIDRERHRSKKCAIMKFVIGNNNIKLDPIDRLQLEHRYALGNYDYEDIIDDETIKSYM